ncbi:short-chain dehydrogenase/reductase [Enterobacter cloacae]|uniref:Short-chain dehydrogenase/reductase n=1 Tax=Enterobacter cloacae TaxID=550 RepID=A0A2T4Y2D7_ENTCL|nr:MULTISPECIES: oxidoreductase [Enterobacter]MCR1302528.1 oxidoreductase [Enterobacter sp. FL1277]MCR1307244.1 oxidoreductase [Enterobacter sp. BT1271]MCR1311728.1 oxidoreductase [Enterobacter sp. BT855]MCR1321671.1 oxidoreductase [Enterobacter sp. BT1268]MCR1326927.1 oxidoreductase [Enterobacter sp. BT1131]
MFTQDKKTALVTGASSGMGKVIARRLIQDGYQVYAAARSVEKMNDLAQLGARALRMDISRDEDILAAVDTIVSQTGGVDVLVNNAGFGLYGPVEEIGIDEARYQFEVNVFGAARLTQLLLPAMRARRRGYIINITSIGGKIYTPLGAWYHATKHALEGWSDCLRLEVAEYGIKVVIVEPGLIETGFGEVVSGSIVKRSASGPYGHLVGKVANSVKNAYGNGRGSDPKVIADVVARAVNSPHPRTRYAAGKYAKMLIRMRVWLGDRLFDRVILSQTR